MAPRSNEASLITRIHQSVLSPPARTVEADTKKEKREMTAAETL